MVVGNDTTKKNNSVASIYLMYSGDSGMTDAAIGKKEL